MCTYMNVKIQNYTLSSYIMEDGSQVVRLERLAVGRLSLEDCGLHAPLGSALGSLPNIFNLYIYIYVFKFTYVHTHIYIYYKYVYIYIYIIYI